MARLLLAGLALLLAGPAHAQPASPKFVGSWSGLLKQGDAEMELVLNIARADTGGFHVYFDLPAQGIRGMQVGGATFSGSAIAFPAGNGRYEGTLNAAGDAISGKVRAGQDEEPLGFRRTSAVPVVPAVVAAVDDPDGRAGDFTGHIELGAARMEGTYRLVRTADGYAATFDIPMQNVRALPASAVRIDGDRLTIAFPFGSYEGTFSADRAALTGTWTQGGRAFPFNLTRRPAAD